jgi:hypothetical protein
MPALICGQQHNLYHYLWEVVSLGIVDEVHLKLDDFDSLSECIIIGWCLWFAIGLKKERVRR